MENNYCGIELGGIVFGMDAEHPISLTERYLPYMTERQPDYLTEFRLVDALPEMPAKQVDSEVSYDVYQAEDGSYPRRFYEALRGRRPYAVAAYDFAGHKATVQCLRDGVSNINHMRGALFHLAWEEILMLEGRLILHACLVSTPRGGILFSGPSGIGKSTQGELWCRYAEDAHIINGDRPILWKKQDGWYACGSPYAGSSEYFLNEQVPIRAIVLLRQAPQCSIRRMRPLEAFRGMWPGLTVSDWNSTMTERATELCADAVGQIPFYALDCTPDRDAVELLQKTLTEAEG